jgi:hypothetical protein
MFNLFKTETKSFDEMFSMFDKQFGVSIAKMRKDFELLSEAIEAQIEEAKAVQPIVTQSDDAVTVTFRSPNVTTTVTASKGNLPEVLKQFGLEMPTMAKAKKPVAKKTAKSTK